MTKDKIKSVSIIFATIVTGIGGIVSQILLLRELLVVFSGSELSVGIIISNWLLSEGIGSFFIGRKIENTKEKISFTVVFIILFSFSFGISIYLVRELKHILGISPYEGLSLSVIFFSSFFILFLPASLHGALFPFFVRIYSDFFKIPSASVGRIYAFETLGTVVGGGAFAYLLLPYFNSFDIFLLVGAVSCISCVFLLICLEERKGVVWFSSAVFILYLFLILSHTGKSIHHISLRGQFKNYNVLLYQNSIYGNIVVTKLQEQYTFFYDGLPVLTVPVPDVVYAEEIAHLSLLSHPNPQKIAILGGGVGGVIRELVKHPSVKRIDYAELDPVFLNILKKFPTPLTHMELTHPDVKIKFQDGRSFIRGAKSRYDIVIVGQNNPSTLQMNRFFTVEFFNLVKKVLNKNGILVLTLPGSLSHIPEELKRLNTCILKTVESVFPYVEVIPGDFNIFLASSTPVFCDPGILSKRIEERKIDTLVINSYYLKYKMDKRWKIWFEKNISPLKTLEYANYDFHPRAVFHSASYLNAIFSPYLKNFFETLLRADFYHIVVVIILIFLCVSFFSSSSVPFATFTTGFAGMIFSLVLIFAFQSIYGYVYHYITLLVVFLMAGTICGAYIATYLLNKVKNALFFVLKIEFIIMLFPIFLLTSIYTISYYQNNETLVKAVFLSITFVSGLLIGVEFPFLNRIYTRHTDISSTTGLIYASDLFGGWLGGITGGLILLPVFGINLSCILLVIVKILSIFFLASKNFNKFFFLTLLILLTVLY